MAAIVAGTPLEQPTDAGHEPFSEPGAIVDPTGPGVAPHPSSHEPSGATAGVTLAWDANSEPFLAGYRLHYGTESRRYTARIDVGNVTEHRVDGLWPGVVYYFAATAYGTNGAESGFSDEISVRP